MHAVLLDMGALGEGQKHGDLRCPADDHRQVGGPNHTDCHGGLVAANWSQVNTPQPHSYTAEEVTIDLCATLGLHY